MFSEGRRDDKLTRNCTIAYGLFTDLRNTPTVQAPNCENSYVRARYSTPSSHPAGRLLMGQRVQTTVRY